MTRKVYHEMSNIGHSKYVVNYHDGVKTHPDGSRFYDIKIFRSKKGKDAFIRELSRRGWQCASIDDPWKRDEQGRWYLPELTPPTSPNPF